MKQKKKEPTSQTTSNTVRATGRIISEAYYGYQNLRLQTTGRIRDLVRKKLEGIDLSKPEAKKDDDEKRKVDYTDEQLQVKLLEAAKKKLFTAQDLEYIQNTLRIVDSSKALESEYKKLMMEYISTEEIYKQFLSKIKGVGPVLSANLIKSFGYCDQVTADGKDRSPYVSSLWAYCGLVPGQKRVKGQKATYNPALKVLVWKIGDSFIKQQTPFYRKIYDDEKERQLQLMEDAENVTTFRKAVKRTKTQGQQGTPPKSRQQAHLRAIRKMVKIFLQHYWTAAREIAGKPTNDPWVIQHGGHGHYSTWVDAVALQKVKTSNEDKVRA